MEQEKLNWLESIGAIKITDKKELKNLANKHLIKMPCDYVYEIIRDGKRIMGYPDYYLNETPFSKLKKGFEEHLEHLVRCRLNQTN